jgi:type IV fimbrial biogenesis protein FimT
MHKQAGFTIMELMIVVAIIGVLGAMALPGLKEWNRNAARTAAVSEFLGSMHLARSESVKRNVRVGMCPTGDATDADAKCSGDKDWASGWLIFVDADGDMERGADEELLGAIDAINPAFSLVSTTGDIALDFRPNGRMETSNLQTTVDFNVCDERGPEQGRVISVSSSGRPETGLAQLNGDKPNC